MLRSALARGLGNRLASTSATLTNPTAASQPPLARPQRPKYRSVPVDPQTGQPVRLVKPPTGFTAPEFRGEDRE